MQGQLFTEATGATVRYAIDDDTHREFSGPRIDMKVRVVCGGCNSGWMSDLETHVAPLLVRVAEGRHASLSKDQQAVLARWALKTALVFQFTLDGQEAVNPEFCSTFYDHLDRWPPNTFVWIGSYHPDNFGSHFRIRHLWPQEVGIVGRALGFVAALAFRQVLFLVYMHSMDRQAELVSKHLPPLMPSRGIVSWPRKRAADYTIVRQLPELFVGGGGSTS